MTDFQKGQTVTLAGDISLTGATDSWSNRLFRKGAQGVVTYVRKNVINVRINDTARQDNYVWAVPRGFLETPNGEVWTEPNKPVTRKLGEVPEGMIAPDDPRLAWLWEDAGKLASRLSFCGEYDQITSKLNIPGRERDIAVTTKINGIHVSATVKARSEKEAEKILLDTMRVSFTS